MHRDPTTGVSGTKPRFKSAKEELPELSKRYLTLRNRQMHLKAQAGEIELALKRGDLVERRLVERQAAFLLVSLRQKLLNLTSHAHRLVGVTDVNEMRKILREIAVSALNELKDLPKTVTDPNCLRKIEQDGES